MKKLMWISVVLFITMFTFHAALTLGISSGLATNLYYVLQGISWASLAVSIVAGMGLGATVGAAIFAAVKKMALKKFIQW